VARAIADLQRRLEVEAEEIEVVSVKRTEFPDASLGVPEPGQSYARVIVPGTIIMLKVNGEVCEYHGAGERVVLVSDQPLRVPAPGQGGRAHRPRRRPDRIQGLVRG
jgi:hypothetical protein